MEEREVFHLQVDGENEGRRLDAYLSDCLSNFTRSRIQSLIEDGQITVGGQKTKAGLKIRSGMSIQVSIPEPVPLMLEPQDIPLDIIYEDKDIIVINKQKDLVVHPAAGNWDGTLVNALLKHCGDSLSDINGVVRPGIVHRIDKDTTGLLVVAKNNTAHQKLSEALKVHEVERTYEAIVDGILKQDEGTVSAAIGRHPTDRKKMAAGVKNGRPAVTHFTVLERLKGYTHVRLELETGRTHQIRVHMAKLGHPVTGDMVYGKKCPKMNTEGQVLHARFLKLIHPSTGQAVSFEAPLPDYFKKLLALLR